MEKVKGNEELAISSEEEWLRDAEKAVPPFTYPPFTKQKTKTAVALTCVLTVIIGLIILSIIVQLLPEFKIFSEAFLKEELTPEEEAIADAATIKLLIFYGIGIVVLAGITVGAAFLAKSLKLKKEMAAYESAKQKAYEQWESNKFNNIEAARSERAYQICPFCGKELTHVYNNGNDKSWYETVYDVSNATSYGTATITPRSVKHEYIDLTNAFNRYSCTNCCFSIESKPTSGFNSWSYKNTTIDIWKDSKVNYTDVRNCLLYHLMKG